MTHANDVVDLALRQAGDEYVLGAETKPSDPDPERFDCSELVQWVCDRLGVEPRMPDGSHWQWSHCKQHQTLIPVSTAIGTRGALLFVEKGAAAGGGNGNHVAISLGDGNTIEARGTRYGVGSWSAKGRPWTHGALIPGVSYAEPTFQPKKEQQPVADSRKVVDLLNTPEGDGGWILFEDGAIWTAGNAPYLGGANVPGHMLPGDVAERIVPAFAGDDPDNPGPAMWGYRILTRMSPKHGYQYTGEPQPPVRSNMALVSADEVNELRSRLAEIHRLSEV